jgi:DNA-binding transcriptional LysR family regulator
MELRQLEAFVSVAAEGGFTRASEALSLTQPAITRQIGGLEAELKVRLLDRLGRRVALTAAGEAFLPYASRVLQLVAEARQAIADVSGGTAGRLSVGVSSTAATYILPPILRRFHDCYPRVELSLRTGPSAHTVDVVAANIVDLGLVMDYEERPGIHVDVVGEYALSVVVHPEHALTRRKDEGVAVADLAGEATILMQTGANLRRMTDRIYAEGAVKPVIAMELDNVESIKKMIAARLGISILPQIAVDAEVSQGTLVSLPLDGGLHRRPIAAVYREDKYLSSAMTAFLEILRGG